MFAFPSIDFPKWELQLLALQHMAICLQAGLVFWGCTGEAYLAGTSPEDAVWAFFDLSFYFFFTSSIVFCLKSLPPQELAWPLCGLGAVQGWGSVLSRSMTSSYRVLAKQAIDECIVDNINNPCFAHSTLGASEEVPHIWPPGTVILVTSPDSDCVCWGVEGQGPIPAQNSASDGSSFFGLQSCLCQLSQKMTIAHSWLERKLSCTFFG